MVLPILKLLYTESVKLEQAGLLRRETPTSSPPGSTVTLGGKELVSFVTDDYLGLAGHQALKQAAKAAIDTYGIGGVAPRMVTGTLASHIELEGALSRFLGAEATAVFESDYHAATGVFESVLGDRDYVFCDEQVHPSIADGLRLSRARVFSYRTNDLEHLEDRLRRSRAARFRLIATDGVFPLDGTIARLKEIVDLARSYEAMVVVNDPLGIGVLGEEGRGTTEHLGVATAVDVVVGSLGHALGGAGGFVSGRRAVVEWLRQKSRPYLVSPGLAPASVAAGLRALELVASMRKERQTLRDNAALLRRELGQRGFKVVGGVHPIVPVMIGDAVATQRLSDALYRKGFFVMGFCHPVVPEGQARLRMQVTLRHTPELLRRLTEACEAAARELKIL